jgi:hypothetical protein
VPPIQTYFIYIINNQKKKKRLFSINQDCFFIINKIELEPFIGFAGLAMVMHVQDNDIGIAGFGFFLGGFLG